MERQGALFTDADIKRLIAGARWLFKYQRHLGKRQDNFDETYFVYKHALVAKIDDMIFFLQEMKRRLEAHG